LLPWAELAPPRYRRDDMNLRIALAAVTMLSILLVGCGTDAGASPSLSASAPTSTLAATPTPIAAVVASPEDAAARVIATDPRFVGATELNPDVIGANKWWEASALENGAYRITITIGWGDCPSGCISHHVWVYEVSADGEVTLIEESGDPVPAGDVPEG
jgi:hypothetical protein